MSYIKRIIKRFFRHSQKPQPKKIDLQIQAGSVIVGNDCTMTGTVVEIRNGIDTNKNYLTIGNGSVVSGNFIFENANGTIEIGNKTFIGGGKFISINNIKIGSDVLVSWGCTFMDNNAHSTSWSKRSNDVSDWHKGIKEGKIGAYKNWDHVISAPIEVKDKAWIGFNCIILKGVTIGEGAIVGSGSVVTKDVPDWTVVAGNPAAVVKKIDEHER